MELPNPLGPASTATPDDALPETWAEGFCDQPGKGCLYYCCPWKAFATIRDLDAHLKEEPVVLPGGLRQSLLDEPDGVSDAARRPGGQTSWHRVLLYPSQPRVLPPLLW
jgi:hypothetical protein